MGDTYALDHPQLTRSRQPHRCTRGRYATQGASTRAIRNHRADSQCDRCLDPYRRRAEATVGQKRIVERAVPSSPRAFRNRHHRSTNTGVHSNRTSESTSPAGLRAFAGTSIQTVRYQGVCQQAPGLNRRLLWRRFRGNRCCGHARSSIFFAWKEFSHE